MCQVSREQDQAQQNLLLNQVCRRMENLSQDLHEISHLFGHQNSTLTAPFHSAAKQIREVLEQLRQAGNNLTKPPQQEQKYVTFVSGKK